MQPTVTLNQFNKLTSGEKYGLIEDYGAYLDCCYLEGKYKAALFTVFGYYVEVWLDQPKDRLIKAIAFSSYKRLDPFLQDVDITPIYALL